MTNKKQRKTQNQRTQTKIAKACQSLEDFTKELKERTGIEVSWTSVAIEERWVYERRYIFAFFTGRTGSLLMKGWWRESDGKRNPSVAIEDGRYFAWGEEEDRQSFCQLLLQRMKQ